jgi:hypothetical protein
MQQLGWICGNRIDVYLKTFAYLGWLMMPFFATKDNWLKTWISDYVNSFTKVFLITKVYLGSRLLHTTNDDPLFYFIFMFSYDF